MIELEDSRENAYDNFVESMRSSETKRMYVRNLNMFLNLIPNSIFEDYLKIQNIEEIPNDKYDFSMEGREFSTNGKNLLDSCERITKHLSDMIELGILEKVLNFD